MKKTILFFAMLIFGTAIFAQIQNPVSWSFSSKKISAGKYEIHLTANIDNGWHIYSQTTPDGGPVPTSISFVKNPLITFEGPAKETGKLEQKHEEMFGVDVKQFSNKVEFIQEITLKNNVKTTTSGTVKFMVCNDTQCLPPKTVSFDIALQ